MLLMVARARRDLPGVALVQVLRTLHSSDPGLLAEALSPPLRAAWGRPDWPEGLLDEKLRMWGDLGE